MMNDDNLENDTEVGPTTPEEIAADTAADRELTAAAGELRSSMPPLSASALAAAASANTESKRANKKVRNARLISAAAVVAAVAMLGAGIGGVFNPEPAAQIAAGPEPTDEMAAFLAELPDQPIDPKDVTLNAGLAKFGTCDDLLNDVRRVGAEHVGSNGFGGGAFYPIAGTLLSAEDAQAATTADVAFTGDEGGSGGDTLGTNIQVDGVDEPDTVKAFDDKIVTIRGNRLRITDASAGKVISITDLDVGDDDLRRANSSQILISGDKVVVFGSESVRSEPVEGDPSAATSEESYVVVTTVDISDPAAPSITDRARIEGWMVSARLVGDQVRMVTGWNMSDIGFVSPTSAESVPTALQTNRESLAVSTITDWIPEWDNGGEPQPLIGCDQVWVPDTFAGVSMTSMVNFTVGDAFEPEAAGLLAPSDVIYATAQEVTIAATVWVDPAQRLDGFKDWDTAIHTFNLDAKLPSHVASGQISGTVDGQFSFGTVGDNLAVVSRPGVPWNSEVTGETELSLLQPNGTELEAVGTVTGFDGDSGDFSSINGIRFTNTRAFVTVGLGNTVKVVDLSDAADPQVAGAINLPNSATYIHPITDEIVFAFGNRITNENDRLYSNAHGELVDSTNPAEPVSLSGWDAPLTRSDAIYNHHDFVEWANRELVAFDLTPEARDREIPPPPYAVFVSTKPGTQQLAAVTPQRVDVAAPCPEIPVSEVPELLGAGAGMKALDCGDVDRAPDFPGWSCYLGATENYTICSRLSQVSVDRVLVVDGSPWIYTNQSLEKLNPTTFASTEVIPIA